MSGWDCPAKIIKVEDGLFWVMSLDDMKEQHQSYRIEMGDHEPESRQSMRAISEEEAREYMRGALAHQRVVLIRIEERHARETRSTNDAIAALTEALGG